MKYSLLLGMLILALFLIPSKTLTYTAPTYAHHYPDRTTMIEWRLHQLAECESTHRPHAINWDDGGSPSYGLYQFKIGTARWFAQKYNLPFDIGEHNILDEHIQHTLAREALNDNQYRHWWNCSKRYGWI